MDDLLKKYRITYFKENNQYQIDIITVNKYIIEKLEIAQSLVKTYNKNEIYVSEDKLLNLLTNKQYISEGLVSVFLKDYAIMLGIKMEKSPEIIKELKGYEKNYLISSEGYIISKKSGKILEPHNNGEYYQVHIYDEGKSVPKSIHILMARTFLELPDDATKRKVDHINGIETDNQLENIRYVNSSQNGLNAYRNGNNKLHNKCSYKKVCKLDLDGNFLQRYNSFEEAARQNNMCNGTRIALCCKGMAQTAGGFKWKYSKLNKNKKITLYENEKFRKIPKIKSQTYSKYLLSNYGKIQNIKTKKYLSINNDKKGYQFIRIISDSGKIIKHLIHRLVGFVFLGFPSGKLDRINHIDENKSNNYYKNLEWITHKNNMIYSCGKSVYQINKETGKIIRKFGSIREAMRYIAEKNISTGSNNSIRSGISRCCNKKTLSAFGYKWRFVD